MMWITVLLSVAALGCLWAFLGWQSSWKKGSREDFQHFVRSLLIVMENWGALHVKHRDSEVAFDFVRCEGTDHEAIIVLQVPRMPWSEPHASELQEVFSANLFDVRMTDDWSSKILAEVRLPVEDIWAKWSGAKGARAAHLLLDTINVPQDAKFVCTLVGRYSKRGLERERRLRKESRA